MGLRVTTNVTAMSAHRSLATADGGLRTSLERLSSGLRINRAADDAAGLAISEGLRSQIGGMTQAVRNTRDGISVVQTAEGALAESTSVLQRMRDLAVQAANTGGLSTGALRAIQTEIGQLKHELTRIADTTSFNGRRLLDGSYDGRFQVGADAGDTIDVAVPDPMGALALGVNGIDVTRGTSGLIVFPARGYTAGVAGEVRFAGANAVPGGVAALRGTLRQGAATLDLGAVPHAPGGSAATALAELNAAAVLAGFTVGPFVDDGGDLVLAGPVPADTATPADIAAATVTFTQPTPPASPIPGVTVDPPRAAVLPAPGVVVFTRTRAPDLAAMGGTLTANGATLDLTRLPTLALDESVALDQVNAAAQAAGITVEVDAFAHSHVGSVSGPTDDDGPAISFTGPVPAMTATSAEVAALTPVYTPGPDEIDLIDGAIRAVSSQRAALGALQNRFEHTIARLGVSIENVTAAESRIRDTDMAAETSRLARHQVLTQAGAAMLAQANQSPQAVLTLLRG